MERIGVFVCHCGTNIAGTVDVEKVAEELGKVNGVVYSTHYTYMCSSAGQKMIEDHIRDDKLTGVVLCSCSPRMHEKTFRGCAERAGLNPYKVEVANIREQDSWVLKDPAEATEKAVALGKAAVAKAILDTPLTPGETPMTKRALVIGGGIAGITAALDIADAGFPVDIVEKKPTIGGKMAQLDKTFPTLDCASCIVTPKMTEVSQNPNIRILSYSEVVGVKGYIGNFSIQIKRHARYVDETKCTGCGECIEKCPMKKVPNDFNLNLDSKKAVYIPFAQAVPKVATIDASYCLHMQALAKGKDNVCGLCAKTCGAGAINYAAKDEIIEEKYGAIVVATGYNPIELTQFDEFAYSQSPDVVSSLEFERLCNASGPTNGHLRRPSDGREPKNIVFVQCVGSRCSADASKGHEYCSKVCCMYTAKHAILTRDHYPDTNCYVFYIDVRTPGKNFDEFYRRAVEQYGVHYIKGMVGKVTPLADGTLDVQGSDLILNKQVHIKADMVVLAASIEADKSARPLATMLTTSMDNNDFFLEAHAKLRPVESPTAGIFLAGCCQGPKDIPETVAQSSGAAAKAICLLVKDKLQNNPCTAHPDEAMCNGCGQCENVCPYGAISYIEKDFRGPNRTTVARRVSQVNTAMCQGCGACTVACPSGAMDLLGFSNKQIMAEVDAVCQNL
ncbi:MAG: CoB--CoM heterodisulfide reductase iron-sulfur subunit A family protein [Treponemataceae bacterium]|nr:CoB--CoM heterodisulfide reductase iron-sulfur subunit A family protein [Treponemataceae bacterium]